MTKMRDIRSIVFEILEGRPFPENHKERPEELIQYVGDSVLELIDVLSPREIPEGLDFLFQELRAEGIDVFINPARLELFLNVGFDYYKLNLLIKEWKQIDGDAYRQALEKAELYIKEKPKVWNEVLSLRKIISDDTDYPEIKGVFAITMIYQDPRILEWELESMFLEGEREPTTKIEQEIAFGKRKYESDIEVINKIEKIMYKFAEDFGMELDDFDEEWLCGVDYPDCNAWLVSGDAVIVSPKTFLEMVQRHLLISQGIRTEEGEYIVEYEIDGKPIRFGIRRISEDGLNR